MYRFVSESGHCVQDSAIGQLCIDDVVFRVPAGLGQASAWDVRSIRFASARVSCGAALVMEVSSCPLRPPLMPQKAAKGADASRSIQTLLLITTYTLPLTTSYLLFITNIYYRSDDNVWHEEGGN